MNNQNHRFKPLIRAHRQRAAIKTDPGTQSKPFLDFKAALIKAGTTTQQRKANASAIRAARAEAKSCLFVTLSAQFLKVYTPEVAAAAAGKEALKIVNRWARLVFNEAENAPVPDERTPSLVAPPDNAQGAAVETPLPDALALLLKAKPRGKQHSRTFEIEMCYISQYVVQVRAPNIEEAHVLAQQTPLPLKAPGFGLVTRTLKIDNQAVRLVHEDFSQIDMDHITGDLEWWIVDDNYDDGD